MFTPVPNHAPWSAPVALAVSTAMLALSMTGCGDSCSSGIAPATGDNGTEPISEPTSEPLTSVDLPTELPMLTGAGFQALVDEAAAANQCVVVDFWGTWCAPCMALFGPLHDELAKIGDGVRPVTVAWDYEEDHADEIETLAGFHALNDAFVTPPADEQAFMDLHIAAAPPLGEPNADIAYPIVAVFGPDGAFLKVFLGGEGTIDPVEVANTVRAALAGD